MILIYYLMSDFYTLLCLSIVNIYNCIDVDFSKINATFSDFAGQEHPIQIILLAIKWLFMEQDCAYWNYSGRKMLFNALIENDLV